MKLFTDCKLRQQSPHANRTRPRGKVPSEAGRGFRAGLLPGLLLDHREPAEARAARQPSPLPPGSPSPPRKPWWAQESLTCGGPRFLRVRSAHNKPSLSQKSCQTKGEQSQVWLVRTCGGNGHSTEGAVLLVQGSLGLSRDERSS